MVEETPSGAHAAPETPSSPLHAQAARIMRRAAGNLALDDETWPHVAAGVVFSLPEIARGQAALEREAELLPRWLALDAAHQPRPWQGSSSGFVCTCGRGGHPCDVRQILDGHIPDDDERTP